MAASINEVRNTVLSILNKNNNGYMTPEEFNLFARQAQLEIFEQYFFDLYQFKRMPQNHNESTNPVDFIDEKLDLFRVRAFLSSDVGLDTGDNNDSTFDLPENHYRTISVNRRNNSGSGATVCQRVEWNNYHYLSGAPLLAPHDSRPVYVVYQGNQYNIDVSTIEFRQDFAIKGRKAKTLQDQKMFGKLSPIVR